MRREAPARRRRPPPAAGARSRPRGNRRRRAAQRVRGAIGRWLLGLIEDRGGLVTEDDLRGYEAVWNEPVAVEFRGFDLRTRGGALRLPFRARSPAGARALGQAERALALVTALAPDIPPAWNDKPHRAGDDGDLRVLTTSLGLARAGAFCARIAPARAAGECKRGGGSGKRTGGHFWGDCCPHDPGSDECCS